MAADPDLSLVLLSESTLPDVAKFISSPRLSHLGASIEKERDEQLVFALGGGGHLLVSLVEALPPELGPAALLGGLSEEAIGSAKAHLIVAALGLMGGRRERDAAFAQLVAALLEASPAIGATFGEGLCYQDAAFFSRAVDSAEGEVPVFLAIDITAAPEPEERISFLTHGMERYEREEFFVTAPLSGDGALPFLLELMHWCISEDERELAPGDTVGRTEDERIVVRRMPSPIGAEAQVIRLDLD